MSGTTTPSQPGKRAGGGRDAIGAAALIAAGTAGYAVPRVIAVPVRFDGDVAWDLSEAGGVALDVTRPASNQPLDTYGGGTTIGLYASNTAGGYVGVGFEYRLFSSGDVRFQPGTSLFPAGRTTPVYSASTIIGPYGVNDMSRTRTTVHYDFIGYNGYASDRSTNIPLNGSTGYLAVRLTIEGAAHYGWLAIRLRSPGDVLGTPTITAWGYETEAGVPIAAGVPGPASLGVLAIGAAGALGRRKRAA